MDKSLGGGGGSGSNCSGSGGDPNDNNSGKRSSHHRHSYVQTQTLEAFFKKCPHPSESQRRKLSRDLGLAPKQIKFWFQNRRTQAKVQTEKLCNNRLRSENKRIELENRAMKEALRNVICRACELRLPPRTHTNLAHLRAENAMLKNQRDQAASMVAKCLGNPISLAPQAPHDPRVDTHKFKALQEVLAASLGNDPFLCGSNNSTFTLPPKYGKETTDIEKTIMFERAITAMHELMKLINLNDPMWINVPGPGQGGTSYVLHGDSYERLFHRTFRFSTSSARIEATKVVGLVNMNATQLVNFMLDSDKRMDLFPTIIRMAKTIEVLEPGAAGHRGGYMELVYEQMHILSPLVPPRDFFLLRYCHKVDRETWVIGNVSYDFLKETTITSRSWKLPSGCMIQELPNGYSKVTWIEHVEVDDRAKTHKLYRDLLSGCAAYGAPQWLFTLQRMCERLSYSMTQNPSELGGVITSPEGRRSIMMLGQRMVKSFCGTLNMTEKLDFPHLCEVNHSGFRLSIRMNYDQGHPLGTTVTTATSIWLPFPPHTVFAYFKNDKIRIQWDVLSHGPVNEVAHISTGAQPGNSISIFLPTINVPTEKNLVILEESCIDPLGGMIVYAPIDVASLMKVAIGGADSSFIPILSSGFVISGDGRAGGAAGAQTTGATGSGGSLLTVAFQILAASPLSAEYLKLECISTVNTLISCTVQKIKDAFNCPRM